MTKSEILDFIKELDGAYYDMPFDFDTYILRRKSAKWFGIIMPAPESYFERYGAPLPADKTVLDLKCPPDLREFLCEKHKGAVLPAYHMNKTHWISVVLSSNVPDEDIKQLIKLSYDITK